MGDFLTEAYEKYKQANPDAIPFQLFQAGFTAGAVSMRERAVSAAQKHNSKNGPNALINALGALPDIPQS